MTTPREQSFRNKGGLYELVSSQRNRTASREVRIEVFEDYYYNNDRNFSVASQSSR